MTQPILNRIKRAKVLRMARREGAWRCALGATVLCGAIAGMAKAQMPPSNDAPSRQTVTHLHLAAEGSVSEAPDVLVGSLTALATSPSATDAQRKVNAMVARGMAEAGATAGIEARATGYAVNQVNLDDNAGSAQPRPRRPGWTAQQVLEIRGRDGERLLALLSTLQDEGLAVASLDWQLSPELRRQARDAAMVSALQALRMRADKAANALGLKVDHLGDVRVDLAEPSPPMPMTMRMAARPAPEATASPQTVTSDVTADVILTR